MTVGEWAGQNNIDVAALPAYSDLTPVQRGSVCDENSSMVENFSYTSAECQDAYTAVVNGQPAQPHVPSQALDGDGDGVPNDTDNCPAVANPDQVDANANGKGDACDTVIHGTDGDGDGVPDATDNCPAVANANQADGDNNGVGNACEEDNGGGGGGGGSAGVSHAFYATFNTFWPNIHLESPSLDMPSMPGDAYTKWTGAYGLGLGYTVHFPYGAFRVGGEMRYGRSAQLHDADNISYYDGTLGMFGGGIGFSVIPVGNDICSLNIDLDFSVGGMGMVEGEANAERGGRGSHWMPYIMLDAGIGPRLTLGAVDLIATLGVGFLWAEDTDVASGPDSETITLGYTTEASGVAGMLNIRLELPGSKKK